MVEAVENVFRLVLNYTIIGIEMIGAFIILFYTVLALICLLKKKYEDSRAMLTKGISTGLSFLLASEVLKTIVAPDWNTVGMTCAILLMRAGMTLLVHWENKMER